MPPTIPPTGPPGVVVTCTPHQDSHASHHERLTLVEFAQRLATLRGYAFAGVHEPARCYPGHVYFVPSDTLTCDEAAALRITGPHDLFGGVVPHAFVGTKAISHPLLGPHAAAPRGWNPEFVARVGDAVLPGFVAFDPVEAQQAGMQLLQRGPVRLKPVRASGGRAQSVARDAAGLQRLLDAADAGELTVHGLVLEQDLAQPRTFSVGQIVVADLLASYFGVQRLTRNRRGEQVFGGSSLTVVRGGFEALLAAAPDEEVRHAIVQAQRYDAAVEICFPGFYASRRNYDVVLGRDATGACRTGVLEQSWRVGGATGPELAALEVFRREPQRQRVRTRGFEVFGTSPEPPAHATVHFRGIDPQVGPLTKYTVVEPDAEAQ